MICPQLGGDKQESEQVKPLHVWKTVNWMLTDYQRKNEHICYSASLRWKMQKRWKAAYYFLSLMTS